MNALHPAIIFKEHTQPLALVHSIFAFDKTQYVNEDMVNFILKEINPESRY